MKAGSGVTDVGGESMFPNPVRDGLSLEMLCDLEARPVCTARSGGAILNAGAVYDSVEFSPSNTPQYFSLFVVNSSFINLIPGMALKNKSENKNRDFDESQDLKESLWKLIELAFLHPEIVGSRNRNEEGGIGDVWVLVGSPDLSMHGI
jgi:hypothetical protein